MLRYVPDYGELLAVVHGHLSNLACEAGAQFKKRRPKSGSGNCDQSGADTEPLSDDIERTLLGVDDITLLIADKDAFVAIFEKSGHWVGFSYSNNNALNFCKLVRELVQMLGLSLQFETPLPDRRALHLQAAVLRLGPVLFDETIVGRVRLS
jgi:hypothetical protein